MPFYRAPAHTKRGAGSLRQPLRARGLENPSGVSSANTRQNSGRRAPLRLSQLAKHADVFTEVTRFRRVTIRGAPGSRTSDHVRRHRTILESGGRKVMMSGLVRRFRRRPKRYDNQRLRMALSKTCGPPPLRNLERHLKRIVADAVNIGVLSKIRSSASRSGP